tara:strand:- start:154 stop:438 length:285 start_codon:yes stop_codon:yes gene_type:complete
MDAKYVPIENVAEYFSVSISTIRAWVRQDRIPQNTYIKVGNTYRFCIPEISEALTHREEAPEEVEDKVVPIMRGPVTTEEPGQVINLNLLDEDQ